MEGHDGEDEYVEISVPTELVRRVVNAITTVMIEWEREQREADVVERPVEVIRGLQGLVAHP